MKTLGRRLRILRTQAIHPHFKKVGVQVSIVIMTILAACQSPRSSSENTPLSYQPDAIVRTPASVGCEQMMESFCEALYSPLNKGNLRLGDAGPVYDIFQGQTENDFNATYFFYSKVKLNRRSRLPADFRDALEREDYFSLLSELLARPSRLQMSVSDRLDDIRRRYLLQSIWSAAIESTLLKRMRVKDPTYHKLLDELVPLQTRWDRDRIRRKLLTEISTSLWAGHPNWRRVEKSFEEVRKHMLEVVESLDIDAKIRADWAKQIKTVRLVLPGSLPEIADEACATTEANAYYYTRLNVITVCAGDFNSEDIYQTLSHELAHSIDADSRAFSFMMQSKLAKDLTPLREQSCRRKAFDCKAWSDFKGSVDASLKDWKNYETDLPEFQTCLQKNEPKDLDDDVLSRAASRRVDSTLASLAEVHSFLRMTKSRLPYPDGSWKSNPLYLNACQTDDLASGDILDADDLVRTFFVAEYQCAPQEAKADSEELLKESIARARDLTVKVITEKLRAEGSYSSDAQLVRDGYASPPDERFADVIGSYTLARVLVAHDDIWERRKMYLATSSWQCSPPSLARHFPTEARAERTYSFAAHSAGQDRRRENLSAPLRDALMCKKDFDFKECSLPIRRPASK